MANRIPLIASEQLAANMNMILKVDLRQRTCQVQIFISSWFDRGVEALLSLDSRALVELGQITGLPMAIFTATHSKTLILLLH